MKERISVVHVAFAGREKRGGYVTVCVNAVTDGVKVFVPVPTREYL